jgi:cytochrome b561
MKDRWPNASVALHWLSAALIVGLAAAGFVMVDLPSGSGGRLLLSRAHTLGGATLMLLTLARLVVRRRGAAVAPLPLPNLHRRGVGAIHALLYVVTFAIGLSGFVTGATTAWPSYLRGGLSEAPALESLASREAHEVLVFVLLSLVALHVGGVMTQQVRRGGIARRMMPFLK